MQGFIRENNLIATIKGILFKSEQTSCIIANIEGNISLQGKWEGKEENSSICYGFSRKKALNYAKDFGEDFILFSDIDKNSFDLIEVATGETINTFDKFIISDKFENNYSIFDGIKFKLVYE